MDGDLIKGKYIYDLSTGKTIGIKHGENFTPMESDGMGAVTSSATYKGCEFDILGSNTIEGVQYGTVEDLSFEQIITLYMQGDLTFDECLIGLKAKGITPGVSSGSTGRCLYFKYNNKNYAIECNSWASQSQVDNHKVNLYTKQEIMSKFGVKEADIDEYFVAVSNVDDKATIYAMREDHLFLDATTHSLEDLMKNSTYVNWCEHNQCLFELVGLSMSEHGKKVVQDAVQFNSDGSATVKFINGSWNGGTAHIATTFSASDVSAARNLLSSHPEYNNNINLLLMDMALARWNEEAIDKTREYAAEHPEAERYTDVFGIDTMNLYGIDSYHLECVEIRHVSGVSLEKTPRVMAHPQECFARQITGPINNFEDFGCYYGGPTTLLALRTEDHEKWMESYKLWYLEQIRAFKSMLEAGIDVILEFQPVEPVMTEEGVEINEECFIRNIDDNYIYITPRTDTSKTYKVSIEDYINSMKDHFYPGCFYRYACYPEALLWCVVVDPDYNQKRDAYYEEHGKPDTWPKVTLTNSGSTQGTNTNGTSNGGINAAPVSNNSIATNTNINKVAASNVAFKGGSKVQLSAEHADTNLATSNEVLAPSVTDTEVDPTTTSLTYQQSQIMFILSNFLNYEINSSGNINFGPCTPERVADVNNTWSYLPNGVKITESNWQQYLDNISGLDINELKEQALEKLLKHSCQLTQAQLTQLLEALGATNITEKSRGIAPGSSTSGFGYVNPAYMTFNLDGKQYTIATDDPVKGVHPPDSAIVTAEEVEELRKYMPEEEFQKVLNWWFTPLNTVDGKVQSYMFSWTGDILRYKGNLYTPPTVVTGNDILSDPSGGFWHTLWRGGNNSSDQNFTSTGYEAMVNYIKTHDIFAMIDYVNENDLEGLIEALKTNKDMFLRDPSTDNSGTGNNSTETNETNTSSTRSTQQNAPSVGGNTHTGRTTTLTSNTYGRISEILGNRERVSVSRDKITLNDIKGLSINKADDVKIVDSTTSDSKKEALISETLTKYQNLLSKYNGAALKFATIISTIADDYLAGNITEDEYKSLVQQAYEDVVAAYEAGIEVHEAISTSDDYTAKRNELAKKLGLIETQTGSCIYYGVNPDGSRSYYYYDPKKEKFVEFDIVSENEAKTREQIMKEAIVEAQRLGLSFTANFPLICVKDNDVYKYDETTGTYKKIYKAYKPNPDNK